LCVVADRIEKRAVVLGLRSGDEVEIVSGIGENEVVVWTGAGTLQEGEQVQVLPPG
jgi:hypothetical protein